MTNPRHNAVVTKFRKAVEGRAPIPNYVPDKKRRTKAEMTHNPFVSRRWKPPSARPVMCTRSPGETGRSPSTATSLRSVAHPYFTRTTFAPRRCRYYKGMQSRGTFWNPTSFLCPTSRARRECWRASRWINSTRSCEMIRSCETITTPELLLRVRGRRKRRRTRGTRRLKSQDVQGTIVLAVKSYHPPTCSYRPSRGLRANWATQTPRDKRNRASSTRRRTSGARTTHHAPRGENRSKNKRKSCSDGSRRWSSTRGSRSCRSKVSNRLFLGKSPRSWRRKVDLFPNMPFGESSPDSTTKIAEEHPMIAILLQTNAKDNVMTVMRRARISSSRDWDTRAVTPILSLRCRDALETRLLCLPVGNKMLGLLPFATEKEFRHLCNREYAVLMNRFKEIINLLAYRLIVLHKRATAKPSA